MRELKFRVWDDFLNDWHATAATTEFMDKCNKGYNFNIVCFGNPERVHIEQYTGLKDKNGKEIYEGDIVENTYEDVGKVRYEVRWECGRFIMESKKPYNFVQIGMGVYSHSSEVIGNIHENGDLLND